MNISEIINLLFGIVGVSSMITSALPNKNEKGKRIHNTLLKVLNVLAFNFGNAKNKE